MKEFLTPIAEFITTLQEVDDTISSVTASNRLVIDQSFIQTAGKIMAFNIVRNGTRFGVVGGKFEICNPRKYAIIQ